VAIAGNHDYANNSARQADHNIAYYDVFSLPSSGQAGGVASNTEAFILTIMAMFILFH
jgi:hypothetical protein